MRRLLLKIALLIAALAAVVLFWLLAGRYVTLRVDQFRTAEMESHPIDSIGYDGNEVGGTFEIGGSFFNTIGVNGSAFPLTLRQNSLNQFVVTRGEKSCILGPVSNRAGRLRILPAAGDKVSFVIERSVLNWSTPFDVNFMTGHSSSWRRNLYYELRWQKASGEKLEMVWRYEQYFYPRDGWTSGFMAPTRERPVSPRKNFALIFYNAPTAREISSTTIDSEMKT